MQNTPELVIAASQRAQIWIKALIDHTVKINGATARFHTLRPGEMLYRAFEDPELNVAELSIATYVTNVEHGNCAYTALPVFVARAFRHSDIYIRTDRGIQSPKDLRGREIGIAEYQHTTYTWVRGTLQDEYGINPKDVQWVTAPRESSVHIEHSDFQPPPGISVRAAGGDKNMSSMLESGELDIAISPYPLSCFERGAKNVARLFPDHVAVENDYYRRTNIFPIIHVMGIRTSLLESYPMLAGNLYKSFVAAKNTALAAKRNLVKLPASSPEALAEVERMTALMGEDYYPYGLGENETKVLDLFLRYHFEQGLSKRRFQVKELFAPI